MRCVFFQDIHLHIEEFHCGVRDEAFVIQHLRGGNGQLILRGEADLLPCIIVLAPESGAPLLIQIVQGLIFALQPILKGFPAAVAVAFHAAELVVDLPADDSGMVGQIALPSLLPCGKYRPGTPGCCGSAGRGRPPAGRPR